MPDEFHIILCLLLQKAELIFFKLFTRIKIEFYQSTRCYKL